MVDLNELKGDELKAAMLGGVGGWGCYGDSGSHFRYKAVRQKRPGRQPKCHCGCGGNKTHRGMANGVCLTSGCELYVMRWVRDIKLG